MVNFTVSNLDAMRDQLRAAGVEVDEKTEELEDIGRFGWAVDPEGNRFELWEPAAHPGDDSRDGSAGLPPTSRRLFPIRSRAWSRSDPERAATHEQDVLSGPGDVRPLDRLTRTAIA